MALIRGAFGGAQIKGSIASVTFQGGPAGTIARTRTVPVNPNSIEQVVIRAVMADLSNRWSNVLTISQRTLWNEYAEMTPLPNRFGELVNKGGRQMFLRTNIGFTRSGAPPIDDAPLTPGISDPITPILNMNTTDGVEVVGVSMPIPVGDLVFIRAGRAVGLARNFYKAPFTQKLFANDATAFPVTIVPPAEVGLNSKRFVAARHYAADGKVSMEVIIFALATV